MDKNESDNLEKNEEGKVENKEYYFDFDNKKNENNNNYMNENNSNQDNNMNNVNNNQNSYQPTSNYNDYENEPKKPKNKGKGFWITTTILSAIIMFVSGFFISRSTLDNEIKSLLWLKKQIQNNYYEEITDEEFYDAAFNGVNGILDKYSRYLSVKDFQGFLAESEGVVNGIGVSFDPIGVYEEKYIRIMTVAGDSPAEEAGIVPGMYIEGFGSSMDDVKDNTKYSEFREFILGKKEGEDIVLKLKSNEDIVYKTVQKKRFIENYVTYRSNNTSYKFKNGNENNMVSLENPLSVLDDETAYINLKLFNGRADKCFDKVMNVFKQENKKNLILDLRSNGGGDLMILCNIAKYFCKDAQVKKPIVAIADYRTHPKQQFNAAGNVYYDYFDDTSKITVLVDNGTASASECLLGCMLDYKTISYSDIYISSRSGDVKTYGKGIMQTIIPRKVDNTDAVKLTTARILWPVTGNCIHDRGVLPEDGANIVEENIFGDSEILDVWNKLNTKE